MQGREENNSSRSLLFNSSLFLPISEVAPPRELILAIKGMSLLFLARSTFLRVTLSNFFTPVD
jgi:hypothetical protein